MTARLLGWLAHILDALLGHRCRLHCGQRVFPTDIPSHEATNHGGDTR